MFKFTTFCLLFLLANFASAQTFEADRGGYYFFSPTKYGYIGLSTVALNMGVGKYVSSGHTIATYDKEGNKKSLNAIDCKDGLTVGLANQKNDYSYLASSFINARNSFYKLILFKIDKSGNHDKVVVNVKSKFSKILGIGKYTLDLKYTFATHDAFLFIFSKYLNNVETFYLVKVKNNSEAFEITSLDLILEDRAFKAQKVSEMRYAFDGENTFSILQLHQNTGNYNIISQEFKLNEFEKETIRNFELGFVGKDFFLSPIVSNNKVVKTYASYANTMLKRMDKGISDYVQYEYVAGSLAIVGLYYKNKSSALLEERADGLFMVRLDAKGDTVLISDLSEKFEFNYGKSNRKSPQYAFLFNNFQFLTTLWFADKKNLMLYEGGSGASEVDLNSIDPLAGLVYHFDPKKNIPVNKYLKPKKSGVYRSVNSLFCLYDLKPNSVGYYTKLSIKKF